MSHLAVALIYFILFHFISQLSTRALIFLCPFLGGLEICPAICSDPLLSALCGNAAASCQL